MSNSFDPLITGFGREALDDDMLQLVEQLLINVVTSIDLVALSTNREQNCTTTSQTTKNVVYLPCSSMTIQYS